MVQVIRDRAVGQVTVIGHTDSIGRDTRYEPLSVARSVAVMRWLILYLGIPTSVMVGRGMGSKKPVA
ncbi:MAG: OmpA family protein, partial [Thermoanaerobaculia bacterium]